MSGKNLRYYFNFIKGYSNSFITRFLSVELVFKRLYLYRLKQGSETVSGPGSTAEQTAGVVNIVSSVIKRYGIKKMLDIPCGDFNWMKNVHMEDVSYTGADIVPELIETNVKEFSGHHRRFITLDIRKDKLPEADLIFCRDCLVHLSMKNIQMAIANVKKSGATYFLTTTFPGRKNRDITTGDWFMLNLQAPPFCFPQPLQLIDEGFHDGASGTGSKSLALWMIKDLP